MKRLALIALLCLLSEVSYSNSANVLVSQCRPFMESFIVSEDKIAFEPTYGTGVCWGTFAMVQKMIMVQSREDVPPIFGVCSP